MGSKRAECNLHGDGGEQIYSLIDELRGHGADIVCMSSVGPAVFALSGDEAVWEKWEQLDDGSGDRQHHRFPVDNAGVRVRLDGVPINYNHEPWWE